MSSLERICRRGGVARRVLPAVSAWALLFALVACGTPPGARPAAAAVVPTPAQTLQALFDADWDQDMRRYPEWATYVGDPRFGGRLHDASDETEAQSYAETRQRLAQAAQINPATLDDKDRMSLALFVHEQQDRLDFEPLVGLRRLSLGAIGGFHTAFAGLLRASPAGTAGEAEQVLARLAAYPRRVDQELQRLRQGLALGWVAPRPVITRVLATLDKQLALRGESSPFYEPFGRLGSEIAAPEQAALRARALQAISAQVLPAQQRLRDFVAGDYAAAAPAAGNLGAYPGGALAYAKLVRSHTTTDLSPTQIHAIGHREVARLRGEIDQVMRDMAWAGDFDSFVRHLNSDPQYFHPSPQALLAAYRDIGKRIDAALPQLFAELPRAPWGVRAMPAEMGPGAAENYSGPALDGSRPGWFNANAEAWRTKPTWGQETLVAHEAVPGHHLQIARAVELGALPKFRRAGGYVAFSEGWALYAETLGFQLGLYKTPASRFGHLQWQMLRAARLVVDTGLHHLGWSRQQAIDYLQAQTGENAELVASEVDRYTSWPGQALGYMIGQLKIIELRDRARSALGSRFDIRHFHMAVLDQGALPLGLLEAQIDRWIAAEAARR